jgi:hypothetical protein
MYKVTELSKLSWIIREFRLFITEALYISLKEETQQWFVAVDIFKNSSPDKRKHLLSGEITNDNTTQAIEKTVDKYPLYKRDSKSWDFLIFILKYNLYLTLLLWFPSNGIKDFEI